MKIKKISMSKLSRSIYFAEGDLLLQTSKTLTASVWHCCDVRHAGRCRAVDRVRRHVRDAPVVFGAHRESGVHSVPQCLPQYDRTQCVLHTIQTAVAAN